MPFPNAKNNNRKNTSSRPLAEFVLGDMANQILAGVAEHESAKNGDLFEEFQKDPIGFNTKVLKNKMTADQEMLLGSVWENVFTLARSATGVGKTQIAAVAAVTFYKCFPGAQVWTIAMPERKLKLQLWGEIRRQVENNKALFTKDKVSFASMIIERRELEGIYGLTISQSADPAETKAKIAGIHAPHLLFIIDEGDAVPPEVYEAIEGCMVGGNAHILVLFNPRSANGPLYQREREKNATVIPLSAFTHPNVTTGKDIIPGAVTRESVCHMISKWTRPLVRGESVTSDCFIVPPCLAGYSAKKLDGKTFYPPLKMEMRKPTEAAFSYMVLGKYSTIAEDQLISRDWCEKAMDRYHKYVAEYGDVPPSYVSPRMGLDVAELGGDFNVGTFRYGGYVAPQRKWGGVDIVPVANEAKRLYLEYGAIGCYIDANGIGAGVWSILHNEAGFSAHRIMAMESATENVTMDGIILGQFYRLRDQGWWTMREWLRTDQTAMLPPGSDETGGLIDQLCSAKYGRMPNGRIKICDNDVMKAQLGGKSPDDATSLMLTFCPETDESGASYVQSHNYDH